MDLNEFINDNYKKKNWFAKNYFFAGSVVIILTNLLLFAAGEKFKNFIEIDYLWHWNNVLYFNRLTRSFLNSFAHINLQHLLLNMLCFSVCGLYLERKIGSIKFILLTLALAFFTSSAVSANNMSLNWVGFSVAVYGLYFYIITEYLFSFIKAKQKRHNIIFGAIVLAVIYLDCCFSGGTNSFSFKIYPYNLMTNLGHYSSAVAGLIVGLLIQITHIKTNNE